MNKPYPWLCAECGKQTVYPKVEDYHGQMLRNGTLLDFTVKDMPIPTCGVCGTQYFGLEQDDLMTKAVIEAEKNEKI